MTTASALAAAKSLHMRHPIALSARRAILHSTQQCERFRGRKVYYYYHVCTHKNKRLVVGVGVVVVFVVVVVPCGVYLYMRNFLEPYGRTTRCCTLFRARIIVPHICGPHSPSVASASAVVSLSTKRSQRLQQTPNVFAHCVHTYRVYSIYRSSICHAWHMLCWTERRLSQPLNPFLGASTYKVYR